MNILQIAQLLGPMRFGDVDGGSKILGLVEHCFADIKDEKLFIDTRTTGDEFLEIYGQLDIDTKKKITAISLKQYSDILVEVLDDLVYIKNQRELVQEQEERTRNNQITVICIFLSLLATWSVFSYHHHVTNTLGIKTTSTLLEFADLAYKIIWPFGDKAPAEGVTPPEVLIPPPASEAIEPELETVTTTEEEQS